MIRFLVQITYSMDDLDAALGVLKEDQITRHAIFEVIVHTEEVNISNSECNPVLCPNCHEIIPFLDCDI
jgi:hypothetical protein